MAATPWAQFEISHPDNHGGAWSNAPQTALADPELGFQSRFCGMFYLVNSLRRIGFTKDFGLARSPGSDLPPFGLIDRLGEWWFGPDYLRSSMHLWATANAAPLSLPTRFTHPSLTRDDTPDRSGGIVRDGRHMAVWAGHDFPLLDWPGCTGRRQLIAAAGAGTLDSGHIRKARGRQRLPQSPGLRWIAALARSVETDLAQRSGDEDLSFADLALEGDVRIVDGAITVRFDLSDLPFAIRFAGLDRDPGWIPQEGRSLAFIYR